MIYKWILLKKFSKYVNKIDLNVYKEIKALT